MIPAESAHDTIAALGEIGLLQFKDLNTDKSAFQRTYANQVCLCWARVTLAKMLQETVNNNPNNTSTCVTGQQVKRCDEMARKLRFFTEQVGLQKTQTITLFSATVCYDNSTVRIPIDLMFL